MARTEFVPDQIWLADYPVRYALSCRKQRLARTRMKRQQALVDAMENVTDRTRGAGWQLKAWFKYVFRMWNNPRPAPEYQFGWKDRQAARASLEQILAWDFERIVRSHGDNITVDARQAARRAWRKMLGERP